jgi:hypothetical protein
MTVTYKTNPNFPGINFPVLHRVVYAETVDNVLAQYQRSYKDVLVDEWCRSNCRHPYYQQYTLDKKFIEFECDKDAMMFALRWA